MKQGYLFIKNKLKNNKYIRRYLEDVGFETKVKLYFSLLINILYVIVNALSFIMYHSFWFAIFASYHGSIALMRFILLNYTINYKFGEDYYGELQKSRLCAYILIAINITLLFIVLMMVYQGRGFEYKGFMIYVIAAYTVYALISTIEDIKQYRKYKSPVMTLSKVIKFASLLFSVLFLETAVFAYFGITERKPFEKIVITITEAVIGVILVTIASCIIIRSNKQLKNTPC